MKRFICIIILFLSLTFLYAKYINVKGIKINEYEIKSEKITQGFNGFKIVHFSDLLYYEKSSDIKKIIDSINYQNPNIVVFTGDVNLNDKNYDNIKDYIKKINADYKYAVLGDHDNEETKNMLLECGFNVLDKNYAYIFNDDINPIKIMDLNNFDESILSNEDDIAPSFVIGLLHKPDEFQNLKKYDIDVIFAGHSLGGQIRLPFWGALIKKDGAKIYSNAYYNENNTKMYISFGIGTEKPHLRLLNKPSINVYRLTSK